MGFERDCMFLIPFPLVYDTFGQSILFMTWVSCKFNLTGEDICTRHGWPHTQWPEPQESAGQQWIVVQREKEREESFIPFFHLGEAERGTSLEQCWFARMFCFLIFHAFICCKIYATKASLCLFSGYLYLPSILGNGMHPLNSPNKAKGEREHWNTVKGRERERHRYGFR